jgi:hypothetical protein
MNTPTWFYSDGQQTYGPVNRDQLITMIQSGQLVPEHFIMTQGTEEWQLVRSSPFAGYLPRTTSATSAVPPQAQHPAPQTAANTPGAPKRPAPPPKHAAGQPPPKKAPVAQAPVAQTGLPSWLGIAAVLVVLAAGWWLTRPEPILERKTVKRIEGEAMKVIQVTGGEVETQPMKLTNALWSGDAHLWWRDGAANYNLDLEFNVEPDQSGKQRLKAAFTSSQRFGIVEVSVDGRKLKGKIFDLQANTVVISGARDLGLHDLAEGPHVLRIGILDTSVINMEKREAYRVGLDYIQLEPPVITAAPEAVGTNIAVKAQPSASFCGRTDHVLIMKSGEERSGRKSEDQSLPRFTWHPHKGGAEWAQYEWESPQVIGECRVFWFDDSTVRGGGCALPAFWRLLYREESTGAWVPVEAAIPAAERDTWNSVKFTPVKTTALRIAVQCLDGWSAGICRWQALAADSADVPKTRERPDLFLGDLSPQHAQVGYLGYRVNLYEEPSERQGLSVFQAGKPCPQYLWAHTNSRIDFAIPSGYTRFTAFATGPSERSTGIPITAAENWKASVLVDGKLLDQSDQLSRYKTREHAVDITFPSGSKTLTLITDTLGDGRFDHAFWAYPTLLTADSQKRPNTPTAKGNWSSSKSTAAVIPATTSPSAPRPSSSPQPVSQPVSPPVTQPAPAGQIARFTFESASEPGKEIANAVQHDGILELDGIYKSGKPEVTLKTPTLDYRRFTVAVRLQPDEFGNQPDNWTSSQNTLLVGGRAGRWLHLGVRPDRRLHFGLDGLGFATAHPSAILTPGEWVTLAVTCDQEARKAELFLNGESVAKLDIKPDVKLEVIGTRWEQSDKEWLFVNYGAGNTLKGAVDELVLYNGVLTAKQIADLKLGGENQRPPRIRAPLTRLAKLSLQRIPTLQLTNASLTEAVTLLKAKAVALDPQNESLKIIVDSALDAEAKRISLDAADIPLAELLQRFARHYKAWVKGTDDSFTFVPRR